MIGQKFGEWTVIGETRKKYRQYYLCQCSCGDIKEVRVKRLLANKSSSCRNCSTRKRTLTHGMSKEPLYGLWKNIRQRCSNEKHRHFKDYGGRGITVCREWESNYPRFKKWMLDNGYKKGLQIDREQNDFGYSPQNCRLTTSKVNNRNRRDNVSIDAFGENKLLMEWSEDQRCSVSSATLRKRIYRFKWQPETAITKRTQRIQVN